MEIRLDNKIQKITDNVDNVKDYVVQGFQNLAEDLGMKIDLGMEDLKRKIDDQTDEIKGLKMKLEENNELINHIIKHLALAHI
jgi:hypothetical protein